MCGIVYAESFDGSPVNNAILQQYDKQKTRGQQGFGVFDGQFGHMKRSANEDTILRWLCKYDSNLILMHHRFPTSTINVARAAHPFSTKAHFGDNQYILVHNGSIRNAEELFVEHQELGINYQSVLEDLTFNDSEALLWDFALFMEGKQKEFTARGGIAFICLKLVKGKLEKMYFARNTSPLNLLRTKEGISLSSEGEGEPIKADTLYTWNYGLKRLTTRTLVIPGYFATNANSGFKYTKPAVGTSFGTQSQRWNSGTTIPARNNLPWDGFDEDCAECLKWDFACHDHYISQRAVAEAITSEDLDKEGGKIRNILARQFPNLYSQMNLIEDKSNTIEYVQDPDTQMMVPRDSIDVEAIARRHQEKKELEDKMIEQLEPISDDEVTQEYMAYLAGVRGHFEQAYWALECDYENIISKPNTKENIRTGRVIERVMERLSNDPEYTSEEAVSNVWEKAWKN